MVGLSGANRDRTVGQRVAKLWIREPPDLSKDSRLSDRLRAAVYVLLAHRSDAPGEGDRGVVKSGATRPKLGMSNDVRTS